MQHERQKNCTGNSASTHSRHSRTATFTWKRGRELPASRDPDRAETVPHPPDPAPSSRAVYVQWQLSKYHSPSRACMASRVAKKPIAILLFSMLELGEVLDQLDELA